MTIVASGQVVGAVLKREKGKNWKRKCRAIEQKLWSERRNSTRSPRFLYDNRIHQLFRCHWAKIAHSLKLWCPDPPTYLSVEWSSARFTPLLTANVTKRRERVEGERSRKYQAGDLIIQMFTVAFKDKLIKARAHPAANMRAPETRVFRLAGSACKLHYVMPVSSSRTSIRDGRRHDSKLKRGRRHVRKF